MSTDTIGTGQRPGPAPAVGSGPVLEAYEHSVMNPSVRRSGSSSGGTVLVWDADGRQHLDLLSGLAVNALGHAHPTVLAAITGQIATLGHVSNFFATPAQVALAGRLAAMTGGAGPRCSSPKRHRGERGRLQDRPDDRPDQIVAAEAVPRPVVGALAITHNPRYRLPFEPLPGDVAFVSYGDGDALAAAVDDTVAAVVLEPIQGENGVVVPPAGYLARARQVCDEHGALLWVDEVQTGMGRAGCGGARRRRGDHRHRDGGQGVGQRVPHRGLRGGRASRHVARARQPRQHVRRQPGRRHCRAGGNRGDRTGRAARPGQRPGAHLIEAVLALDHPAITGVRGRGTVHGPSRSPCRWPRLSLTPLSRPGSSSTPPSRTYSGCAPPLVIGADQLDSFVDALPFCWTKCHDPP